MIEQETIGRIRIVKTRVFDDNRMPETGQADGIGLLNDLLALIEILENFLRSAERLFENVVNAGEPLDGFIEHQQRDDEAGETAGRHRADLDLLARVSQERDDGDGSKELDHRRSKRLLRNVAEIAALQIPRGDAEAVRFQFLRAECLHHLMAADGLLQNFVEVGCMILNAPRRAANAASNARRGDQNKGEQRETDQSELPIDADQNAEQANGGERLPQPVGENMRGRDLNFFDVVHDGRHHASGRIRFEELRILPQDAIEDLLPQIGDSGNAHVVNQIIAGVVAQSLHEKDEQDGNRDHHPDVMNRGWQELVKIDRFVNQPNVKTDGLIGNRGSQDLVENRLDEQSRQR